MTNLFAATLVILALEARNVNRRFAIRGEAIFIKQKIFFYQPSGFYLYSRIIHYECSRRRDRSHLGTAGSGSVIDCHSGGTLSENLSKDAQKSRTCRVGIMMPLL